MSKLLNYTTKVFGGLLLTAALAFTGCGKSTTAPETPPAEDAKQSTETVLNTDVSVTPEGVTNRFFTAFFSGQDQEAWELLTHKAQEATRENFVAQASDTVNWEITKKNIENGMAYVFVDVSDLTENGDRATEELVFALRQDNQRWGVAGFSAGSLAVNFEETVVESCSTNTYSDQQRVSQVPSGGDVY